MAKVKLGDVAREYKCTSSKITPGTKIVGLEHLIPQEITLSNWQENVDNTFSKAFKKGQVLFGRRRAYLKKAVYAPFDGICSGDITVIEAIKGKIEVELLPFIIQNDAFFDYAVGKSAGSLSPRVKWEHLKNYEFELPSLEDQKKLAKILWAAEKLKARYNYELLTLQVLTETIIMAQINQGNSKELWEVATIICGQSPDGKSYNGNGNGMAFYQGKTLFGKKYIMEPNQWTTQITKIAIEQDILMSVRAPVGPVNLSVDTCCIGRGLAAIRAKCRNDQTYLYNILHCLEKKIAQKGVGTTFEAITKDDLHNIEIPWANSNERQELCTLIEKMENMKNMLESQIKYLYDTQLFFISGGKYNVH